MAKRKITVSVDEETHRLAKEWAAENGTTVSALVRDHLVSVSKKKTDRGDPEFSERREEILSEVIAAIFARGGGLAPGDNLSRGELYDRDAFRGYGAFDSRRLTSLVINEKNAKKIESLFREHLERNFKGTGLKFDPILVESTYDQYDRDTFRVTVIYEGDYADLKPGTLNSISTALLDEYEAMGIFTTVLESYVTKEEWDMRGELMAPEPWEILDPSEFGHLEDC